MNYQKLYEKRVKAETRRGYIAIIGGVVNIAAGVLILKHLRDERK